MRLIENLFRHSYITLKQQSLAKISVFRGFLEKSRRFAWGRSILQWDQCGKPGEWGSQAALFSCDGRGDRIRTSDLSVPNQWFGKNVSICLFKSCSHQRFLRGFYILSHPLVYATRRVLGILVTNFPLFFLGLALNSQHRYHFSVGNNSGNRLSLLYLMCVNLVGR